MGLSHRRTVSRPLSAEDWEARKAQISKLYGYMSLNCLMKLMEEEYFFKATCVSVLSPPEIHVLRYQG